MLDWSAMANEASMYAGKVIGILALTPSKAPLSKTKLNSLGGGTRRRMKSEGPETRLRRHFSSEALVAEFIEKGGNRQGSRSAARREKKWAGRIRIPRIRAVTRPKAGKKIQRHKRRRREKGREGR